jgi:hypothetical protein
VVRGPAQRRAQVVLVDFEHVQPVLLVASGQLRLGAHRELREPAGVPSPQFSGHRRILNQA